MTTAAAPSAQQQEFDARVKRYLATLRRIPAEVRQSMATRAFTMDERSACVCGWAIREELRIASGLELPPDPSAASAESFSLWTGTPERCAELFGGEEEEWDDVFGGVCSVDLLPAIETAFAIAVSETVRVPRRAQRDAQ